MLILGISELDNDSGVALVADGELVGAVNEERFSRIKQQDGVPRRSIDWVLQRAGAGITDVDRILVVRQDVHSEHAHSLRTLDEVSWFAWPGPLHWKLLNYGLWKYRNYPRIRSLSRLQNQRFLDWTAEHSVDSAIVERPDHHRMHAACAYYGSGFDTALAFTVDGQGDGKTATVYLCRDGEFELLHEVKLPHSAGVFYAALTRAAGYRPARHEGKITGLAARGEYDEECMAFARRGLYNVNGSFEAPHNYGSYPSLRRLLRRKGPERLARAYQQVLEDVLVDYVAQFARKTGVSNLCLAGGVCANVRVNQRLHQIPEIEKIFVFPHMADGGLGWGAAYWGWHAANKTQPDYRYEPRPLRDVFWGPEYGDDEIRRALEADGVRFRKPDDLESEMAELLSRGELIARFHGAMEYGPRALCHRSILYQPTDPTVNDWLNAKLNRTEFMPFAPVTRAEDASDLFHGLSGAEHSTQFMTITLDCTELMARSCPAVVHVDNTARPQIVQREVDPSTHLLLTRYQERTGLKAIINTSLNIHEEPIVCSPQDAIRACHDANFRYLAIGPFLAEFEYPGAPYSGSALPGP